MFQGIFFFGNIISYKFFIYTSPKGKFLEKKIFFGLLWWWIIINTYFKKKLYSIIYTHKKKKFFVVVFVVKRQIKKVFCYRRHRHHHRHRRLTQHNSFRINGSSTATLYCFTYSNHHSYSDTLFLFVGIENHCDILMSGLSTLSWHPIYQIYAPCTN